MDHRTTLLHLSLINGIGPAIIEKFYSGMVKSKLTTLYHYSADDFMQCFGLSRAASIKIVRGLSDSGLLEKELKSIMDNAIHYCVITDSDYPELLKNIHLPPTVLYYRGAPLAGHQNSMAIVGSRKANMYGQRTVESIIPSLIDHHWSIVSGGAIGADTMAHRAAVQHGGKTVAVLGSGLLSLYPSSNKRLFEQIVANGGTLVSSFSARTMALPGNFPARNRIISGLSRGCVVIQAAEKSGARITALFSLNQGREVFAVPGSIDDALSAGCHALIQQGAKLITSAADILEEFGVQIANKKEIVSAVASEKFNGECLAEDQSGGSFILKLCTDPTSLDELVASSGMDFADLKEKLFDLQLQGKIFQDISGLWKRV